MRICCKKLHTRVPGLVRGGGEEKTNCDWIDLKSRGSFLSEDLLKEVEIFPKNTWRYPR